MAKRCVAEENLQKLTLLSRFVDEIANRPHANARPFVGNSAFAHKGGLHVAAVMKDENSYQHIDPHLVGNAKRILVSELSGRGNIISKAEEFGLVGTGGKDAAWNNRAKTILSKVKALENKGYTFEGAEASVELMIRRATPDYRAPFELVDFNVLVGHKVLSFESPDIPFNDSISQATVKVEVTGVACNETGQCPIKTCLEVAEGNGPVDALNGALRKALCSTFPALNDIILTDYKVRILDNENNTAAITRVMIEFADKSTTDTRWTTVSAHPNVIVASLNALIDGFEYGMLKRLQKNTAASAAAVAGAHTSSSDDVLTEITDMLAAKTR